MPVTAEELMDDPEFIDKDASIEEVTDRVEGAENTLIVKDDGKAVGEIHEHSLLKLLIPQERIDEEKVIGILGLSYDKSYTAERAEDLMNRHEITVPPDEDVQEIAFLMDKEDVRAIPVKDDDIVGVVHENAIVGEI